MTRMARYGHSVLEAPEYHACLEAGVDALKQDDRERVNAAAGTLEKAFMIPRPEALHILFRIGVAAR